MTYKSGKSEQTRRSGDTNGVVKIMGQEHLSKEFLEAEKEFDAALTKAHLRDEGQRNDAVLYHAQLRMFGLDDETEDLISTLNGSGAIGGFNRSLASMTETGIYVPEGAGIRLSKENQKAIMELQKMRAAGKGNNSNNNGESP